MNPDHDLTVYPNPAKDMVFINIKAFSDQKGTIRSINQIRQVVRTIHLGKCTTKVVRISLIGLESDLYFINTTTNGQLLAPQKLLIK